MNKSAALAAVVIGLMGAMVGIVVWLVPGEPSMVQPPPMDATGTGNRAGEPAPISPQIPLEVEASARQLDQQLWRQIKRGMSEEEVVALLGQPKEKTEGFDRTSDVLYSWSFAPLVPASVAFPKPLGLTLRLHKGKVRSIEDPFNGAVSADGKPTRPMPLAPADLPVYSHYPRVIDLRWYPAAGKYPMRYEIEITARGRNAMTGEDKDWGRPTLYTSDVPYLAHLFVGAQQGRWRVRAVNALGTSEWSDYCVFEFKQ